MSRRSWFAVEGPLEPISYEGLSFFRQLGAALNEIFPLRRPPGGHSRISRAAGAKSITGR